MKLYSNLIASMGEPNAARAWRRAIFFNECLERSLESEKLARFLFRVVNRRIADATHYADGQAAIAKCAIEIADEEAARASYWRSVFLINSGLALITAWARVLEIAR